MNIQPIFNTDNLVSRIKREYSKMEWSTVKFWFVGGEVKILDVTNEQKEKWDAFRFMVQLYFYLKNNTYLVQ